MKAKKAKDDIASLGPLSDAIREFAAFKRQAQEFRMTKLYIAFSIHGTNEFRVATKEMINTPTLMQDLEDAGFTVAVSRRRNHNPKTDGVKLHWNKLKRKDGTPLQNKGWVTKRFNELQAWGWKLVADKKER